MVLRSSNPELVLTVPDLLEAALNDSDAENWRKVKAAATAGDEASINEINAHWKDPRRDQLVQAVLAKQAFQRLADDFFSHNHCSDSEGEARNRRSYLQNALAKLAENDTVVTTNWDTLSERVLMEQGRWFPTDGYGFKVRIMIGPLWGRRRQEELVEASNVKVLKLHGGTGWFRTEENAGKIYLRHARYLQYFTLPGHPEIHDIECPQPGHGPDLHPVVVFPSYLKNLEDEVLQAIWDQAARALYSSDRITFVGYSLPAADVAIRALLNPIRKRLADGNCSVTAVVGDDSHAERRWKTFLGHGVIVLKKTARDFFG